MTKTKEELDAIKKEVESLTTKLKELTQEELQQIVGGDTINFDFDKGQTQKEIHIYKDDVKDGDEFHFKG